jgi:hypothetical protein
MLYDPLIRAYFPGVFTAISLAFVLTGCDIDGSDNLPPVSDQGLVMYAEANRHETEDSAQIAAAVFINGEPVSLVGGDVFEARTATDRVLLTKGGYYDGTYAESLPVDSSVPDVVYFNIVHEPVEARADRWYPVDMLNIDPGPGELVGKSAMVTFPQQVTINEPVANTEYTDINDAIDLSWEPGNGDSMRVLAAIECTDGLATSSYGTVVDLAGDDGFETISMDQFIYDLDLGVPVLEAARQSALVMLQELLNDLSAGNIDPDFVFKQAKVNPIDSMCEIRLFLQRQLPGQFDVAFDDGTVVGSTSAEVTVIYLPAVAENQ